MPVYCIRLRAPSTPLRALAHLEKFGTVLGYEVEPDGDLTVGMIEEDLAAEMSAETDGRGRPLGASNTEVAKRDAEIVELYQADPRANSSQKLANRFGVSRERICQILRRNNIIEHVAERKRVARETLAEESELLRAQTKADFDARVERILESVKGGSSIREALAASGLAKHGTMSNMIGRLCRQRGIEIKHGPHRDFSARRARISELASQGKPLTEVLRICREEGDLVHSNWIHDNMPEVVELFRQRRQKEKS